MRCDEVKVLLPEFSRVEAGNGEELKAAAMHLLQCPTCQAEAHQTAEVWRVLEYWEIADPGPQLGEAAKNEILLDLRRERTIIQRETVAKGFRRFFLPVFLGLISATLSVAAVAHRIDVFSFDPVEFLTCGILWAGAYILAFWLALDLGHHAEQRRSGLQAARISALMGLIAMALCLIQARTCSLATAIEYCRTDLWIRAAMGAVDLSPTYFLIGALYASIPIIAASALVGRGRPLASRTHAGLWSGLIYAALLLPAIFLQCGSFTLGASLTWMGGAAVGALGGGVSGAWLAWRKPATASALA